MTVQVRPAPTRTWSNGIRPFQAAKPGPQLTTYTLKNWRPPVPEPLPPAPLLGLPSLLALGALVLSQIWGRRNPNRERIPAPNQGPVFPDVYLRFEPGVVRTYNGRNCGVRATELNQYQCASWYTGPGSDGAPVTDAEPQFFYRAPAQSHPALDGVSQNFPAVRWHDPRDGQTKESWLVASFHTNNTQRIEFYPNSGDSANWQAFPDGTTTVPMDTEEIVPEAEAELSTDTPLPGRLTQVDPALIPKLLPLPLPGGQNLPDPLNPQPATAPQTSPGIGRPLAPPLVRPAPAGTTVRPVTPYLPAVTPAVTATPADVHYPAPGVPITSNPPAATLKGIAQEVGRIENKVNRLLNPEAGTGLDKLELIRGTLSTLLEFLTSITSGGSYSLEAPCQTAEDGGPLVVEHPYSGALNSVMLLHNKVDALAALVQTHKNMRQPVCKPAPPTGQPVTVQFEEI